MKVQSVFNILILSLSLATVILTLLTYFIYKIKLLPKSGEIVESNEGTFFKKVDRHGRAAVTIQNDISGSEQHETKKYKVSKMVSFFALICLIIFATLLFQDAINSWSQEVLTSDDSSVIDTRVPASEGSKDE